MKLEHVAFNVSDPVAMASWYCQHCGFRVVHAPPGPAKAHFIADDAGMILEIYCNPPDQVPDYRAMHPLNFHLAFASENPDADANRLCAAGCRKVEDLRPPDGSIILMLRDPWGVPFQLCKRGKPFK